MSRVKVKQRRPLTLTEKVDIKVARAVALEEDSPAHHIAKSIAGLGDQPPMVSASATVLACGLLFRDRRLARAGARMLAALGIATLAKTLLKDNIDRTRPGEVIEKKHYRLDEGTSKAKRLRSMPSGHSASVTAVLRAAARDYPEVAAPLMGGALGIAAAQLPTRNHFLTDIAAGVALGLASEKMASVALDRAEQMLDEQVA